MDRSDRDTEKPRDNQPSHVADGGVGKRDAETELHAPPDQGRHLNQELQDTADENAYGKRSRGVLEMTPDDAHGKQNGRDIQQDGSSGGQTEHMQKGEDNHGQRRAGGQKKIREEKWGEI